LIRITFSSKGGRIKEALLKKHYKTIRDSTGKESKELVKLLNAPENKFEYNLPVTGTSTNTVKSSDLYFTSEKSGNVLSFKAKTSNGGYFEQKYELSPDNYTLKYAVSSPKPWIGFDIRD
jgi:YidC/Oxa1 family membrane protein insertase